MTTTPLKVALLGCGVVGSQVARLLLTQDADLRARIGRPLELVGIAVRRLELERPGIDRTLLTDDALALASRTDVDLVIELLGGIEPARSLILAAIAAGSSVVTANKACWPRTAGRSTPPPSRRAWTSTTRRRSPARSRSSGRCGSRWSVTR